MITSLVLGREANDCAIASLAMYLNHSYEHVLRAVSQTDGIRGGEQGLFMRQIKKAAKLLGQPLHLHKKFDWESDYGILMFDDHAVVLRNGLIIDPDGSMWEWDDFVSEYGYTPERVEGLLTA
jgi:ABC-type bacteriocin/lantibiotic exporter with double-glycine peptidase domain